MSGTAARALRHARPDPGEPRSRVPRLRRREGGPRRPGPCANPRGVKPPVPAPPGSAAERLCPLLVRWLFLFCHLPVAKHCWEPHVGDAAALFQAQEAAAAAQGLGRSTRFSGRLPEPGTSRGSSGRGARWLPQPCPRRPGVPLGSAQTEPAPGGVRGDGGAPAPKQRGLSKLHPRVTAAPEAQGQAVGSAGGMGRGRGDYLDREGSAGGPLLRWWGVPGWRWGSPLPFLTGAEFLPAGGSVRCAGSVPSALSPPSKPEREGSERARGAITHPGTLPDAPPGPRCTLPPPNPLAPPA